MSVSSRRYATTWLTTDARRLTTGTGLTHPTGASGHGTSPDLQLPDHGPPAVKQAQRSRSPRHPRARWDNLTARAPTRTAVRTRPADYRPCEAVVRPCESGIFVPNPTDRRPTTLRTSTTPGGHQPRRVSTARRGFPNHHRMSWHSWLTEQVIAALALIGLGGGGGLLGYLRRTDRRSREAKRLAERNEKRLQGTEDPNDEGVLAIVYDTRQRVDRLEGKMDDGFREVNSRLDDLNGADYTDDD